MTFSNIVSWNVAGLTAFVRNNKKLLNDICNDRSVDILCLQETKLQEKNADKVLKDMNGFEDWHKAYACSTARLGHAGVMTLSRQTPIGFSSSIGDAGLDREGRLVVTEYSKFILVNVYVPNSGSALINISRRLELWDPALQRLLQRLNRLKPAVLAGDLNVAVEEIDIHAPTRNRQSPGFTDAERHSFRTRFLEKGSVDTWRHFHPGQQAYTFFSKKQNNRPKNKGWRLDYFLVPKKILKSVVRSEILDGYPDASDHLPIMLTLSN